MKKIAEFKLDAFAGISGFVKNVHVLKTFEKLIIIPKNHKIVVIMKRNYRKGGK